MKLLIRLLTCMIVVMLSFNAQASFYIKSNWLYSSPLNKSLNTGWKIINQKLLYQLSSNFSSGASLGIGAGYSFGSLALDVTGNYYFNKSIFTGRLSSGDLSPELLSATLHTKIIMLNITYIPYRFGLSILSISPYITGGIGYSHNRLESLTINNITSHSSINTGRSIPWTTGLGLETNFPIGLAFGIGYQITSLGTLGTIRNHQTSLKPKAPIVGEIRINLKYNIV